MSTLPRFDSLPLWEQYVITAIRALQVAAGLRTISPENFNPRAMLAIRPSLPYVVHETSVADVYILLNRDYKPLGLSPNDHVDYAIYEHLHVTTAQVALMAGAFVHHQKSHGIEGTFFDDRSGPAQSKSNAAKLIARLTCLLAAQHQVPTRRIIETYGL